MTIDHGSPACACYACLSIQGPELVADTPLTQVILDKYGRLWINGEPVWMILCATCGNKRCPHAADHQLTCTNSNEPGQPGSNY